MQMKLLLFGPFSTYIASIGFGGTKNEEDFDLRDQFCHFPNIFLPNHTKLRILMH